MDETARRIRKFVFDSFLEQTTAPSAEEIARDLHLSVPATKTALRELDAGHHLKLLEGTSRILMAFPFSALPTPYRVTRPNGQRYFANCAWDSIAFHPMLGEPIRVDSFCDRCGEGLTFHLEGGRGIPSSGGLPYVHLQLPASVWWNDITRTCANTMVFLGPEEVEGARERDRPRPSSGLVTVDQIVQMSIPIYAGKLRLEYDRPTPSEVRSTFERLGLTGPHWTV